MKKLIIIIALLATISIAGCVRNHTLREDTSVKVGRIVGVQPFFDLNEEWFILTWEDGTSKTFLGLWTAHNYYPDQVSRTVYYRGTSMFVPGQIINMVIYIAPLEDV